MRGECAGCYPLTGCNGRFCPHQPPAGGSPEGEALEAKKKRTLLRPLSVSKNLPLRGRCPEGAEGENLAIAQNISGNRTVLSPTACGRSPLAEGAKG